MITMTERFEKYRIILWLLFKHNNVWIGKKNEYGPHSSTNDYANITAPDVAIHRTINMYA